MSNSSSFDEEKAAKVRVFTMDVYNVPHLLYISSSLEDYSGFISPQPVIVLNSVVSKGRRIGLKKQKPSTITNLTKALTVP